MIKAVLLDFDGVILESTDTKTQAFRDLFSEHPKDIQQCVVEYHLANLGISRFDKFRHIYENILRVPLGEADFTALCTQFESLVYDRVINAPFVKGALEFIRDYSDTTTLIVISNTPHQEIQRIVKALEIDGFFAGVFGSPTKKEQWIWQVLNDLHLSSHEVVFVGDTESDLQAARTAGIPFIGRVLTADPHPFVDPYVIATIPDLSLLAHVLQGYSSLHLVDR